MRITNFKKHDGEEVWCYCVNEPKRIIEPTKGFLWKDGSVIKALRNGLPGKKSLCYQSASKWKRLQIFTDKQECIDAFIEECRIIVDKYDSLIQQTNKL